MRTIGMHTRVASFIGAVALVAQISPAPGNRPGPRRQSTRRNHLHEMGGPASCGSSDPFFGLFEGFAGGGPWARSSQRFSGDKRA